MCMIVITNVINYFRFFAVKYVSITFTHFSVVKLLKTDVYTRADTILSGDKMHKMWFSCAMKMEIFISCDKMQ